MSDVSEKTQNRTSGILSVAGLILGIGGFLIRLGQSTDIKNTPPEIAPIRATVPNASGDLASLGIAVWDTPLMRGVAIAMMVSGVACYSVGHWLGRNRSKAG